MCPDCSTTPRHPTIRVNLLRAHGTRYRYQHGCRCVMCRAANAEDARRYRALHPGASAEYIRRWKAAHPGVAADRTRRWNAAHPGAQAEYSQRHRAAHPDEGAEYQRRYRIDHPGADAEYMRRWSAAHPVEAAERSRRWSAAHPDERRAYVRNRRARERKAIGTHTPADVLAQHGRQRGRCYWCRGKTGESYHVDHVIPLILGGGNGPENLVIACPSCNCSKGAKHPMDFAGRLL